MQFLAHNAVKLELVSASATVTCNVREKLHCVHGP